MCLAFSCSGVRNEGISMAYLSHNSIGDSFYRHQCTKSINQVKRFDGNIMHPALESPKLPSPMMRLCNYLLFTIDRGLLLFSGIGCCSPLVRCSQENAGLFHLSNILSRCARCAHCLPNYKWKNDLFSIDCSIMRKRFMSLSREPCT